MIIFITSMKWRASALLGFDDIWHLAECIIGGNFLWGWKQNKRKKKGKNSWMMWKRSQNDAIFTVLNQRLEWKYKSTNAASAKNEAKGVVFVSLSIGNCYLCLSFFLVFPQVEMKSFQNSLHQKNRPFNFFCWETCIMVTVTHDDKWFYSMIRVHGTWLHRRIASEKKKKWREKMKFE